MFQEELLDIEREVVQESVGQVVSKFMRLEVLKDYWALYLLELEKSAIESYSVKRQERLKNGDIISLRYAEGYVMDFVMGYLEGCLKVILCIHDIHGSRNDILNINCNLRIIYEELHVSAEKTRECMKFCLGDNFIEDIDEQINLDELKKEWVGSETKYILMRRVLKARLESHMSREDLAEETGISLEEIIKIETANADPSLSTLNQLAKGLGMDLRVEFIPIE